MKIILTVILMSCLTLAPNTNSYADQVPLNTRQIIDFLSGRKIEGNQNGTEWFQTFTSGGRTDYAEKKSRPSSGRWQARNDQYCSQWPPSDQWDCYTFTADGENLVFIPEGGGELWPAVRQPQ